MRGGWFLRAMVLGAVPLIAGCAARLLGSITLNHIVAVTSATTTAWSGKGMGELALDHVTGKDCRFLDGALRKDRDVCEPEGSAATEEDLKGVMTVVNYVRAMQYLEDGGIIVVDGATIRLGGIKTVAGAPEEADGTDTRLGTATPPDPNLFAFQRNVMPGSYRGDFYAVGAFTLSVA
jgi:hypothetical protein